jgi:class 3 adenylate cyclase
VLPERYNRLGLSILGVEYSEIGPTVHLAARMEQLAVPGTVRLTAATTMYREMDMRFWLEQAEEISRALA